MTTRQRLNQSIWGRCLSLAVLYVDLTAGLLGADLWLVGAAGAGLAVLGLSLAGIPVTLRIHGRYMALTEQLLDELTQEAASTAVPPVPVLAEPGAQLYADEHITVALQQEPVRDLLRPETDMPVIPAYRVRLGDVDVTYVPATQSWYVHLPGHALAVGPLCAHPYSGEADGDAIISVDHDRNGRPVGIEIV